LTFEEITPEFITQSTSQLCQTMPELKKGGGPYSKDSKQKRRDEVYRLHFDYGYSARKIADTMKVNRNTINSDVSYFYGKLHDNIIHFENETMITSFLHRLEIQRCRVREKLEKTDDPKEYVMLEKLLLDVDSRLISSHQKSAESTKRIWDLTVYAINQFFKDEKKDVRYMSFFDKIAVSEKSQKRIQDIINQDKKKVKNI
jgi:hypothetical protein